MNYAVMNLPATYHINVEPNSDKPYAAWCGDTFLGFFYDMSSAKWACTEHASVVDSYEQIKKGSR